MANRANRLLWWFLFSSLLVYLVLAHVVSLPANPDLPISLLLTMFGAVAIVTTIGSLVYRRHALVGPIQRGEIDLTSPEGQGRAVQPFILGLVLSESVGIYGLLLALLSGQGQEQVRR